MVKIIEHGQIIEISLERPPVNAMNQQLIGALLAAHESAVARGAHAVIISGTPGMFSGGLDVPELLTYDRDAIGRFWEAFFLLMFRIASSPIPVLAAITGHAPAGGAVLAMHCDYRVAATGEFKLGLNEIQVGLPVPRNILYVLEAVVGVRQAARLATAGLLLSPADALTIGLVDELTAPEHTVEKCVTVAQALIDLPPVAMNTTRLAAKSDLLERLGTADDARIATDYWFSDETQFNMKQLVARLSEK